MDFSFADVPEQQEEIRQQSNRQYLAFNLGNEEYALDITRINEIIKVREFTDVPRVITSYSIHYTKLYEPKPL